MMITSMLDDGRRPADGDGSAAHRDRRGKPAVGRPVLFAVMLCAAAAIALGLLIIGPTLNPVVAVGSAAAVVVLVLAGWVLAGPRL